MLLVEFSRHSSSSLVVNKEDITFVNPLTNFNLHHLVGRPHGGLLPHNPHEHVRYPNFLAVNSLHGLNILHLRTGLPLMTLNYNSWNTRLADVNSDNNVDTVTVENECQIDAYTLSPSPRLLFSTPLCKPRTNTWTPSLIVSNGIDEETMLDTSHIILPVVLPRYSL